MIKRMIAVVAAFSLLYTSICIRLYKLAVSGTETANTSQRRYTIDVNEIRGEILDCNGERLVMTEYENIAAARPTYKALKALENVLNESQFLSVKERIQNSNAVTIGIGKSTVDENEDIIVLKKYQRYADSGFAAHTLGYINGEGRGVYGIEKSFDNILYTGKNLSVSFMSDVHGRVLGGTEIQVNNKDVRTGSVMLTLDSRIQNIVEKALDENRVVCGGAVVVENETGAIRAAVSRPGFAPDNVSEYLEDKNSPLLNRTLNPYSVGSVFKVVVAAAAIEGKSEDFTYECKGECDIDGTVFSCNDKTAHGKLDLTKALECSCNTFFIELARKVGAEKILEAASLMGFGQEIRLAEGMISKSGMLPSAYELRSSGEFANFSFGQGRFSATMLQLCNMMSCVAGKGKYYEPYLIEKVTGADGNTVLSHRVGFPVYVFSERTSAELTSMLESVIENGNAGKAKLENGITAAGKTATAQTGVFDSNGVELCNTWFAGFFSSEYSGYSVVILKEGGRSGAEDCAPIFKDIADEIIMLEKNS